MNREQADGVSVEQLYQELDDVESATEGPETSQSDELVGSVTDSLFPERSFRFDEALVKNSLDELLLVLVAMRESETHGKGLMEDLSELFDARLSPGTVYPRLHDLEKEDVLEMHELVRTKEYRLEDSAESRSRVESAMCQHLALGFVFYSVLEDF